MILTTILAGITEVKITVVKPATSILGKIPRRLALLHVVLYVITLKL
jgi:hypothetical protein